MGKNREKLHDAIPTWAIVNAAPAWVVVKSPTFDHDGMTIEGSDVEEVVQRVRNVERIWALALEREGSVPVRWPSAGAGRGKAPASKPAPGPVAFAPSGDACGACQSLNLVRTGTCQTCQNCGTTTGCA
jgi:hypothetical protein